eukprot:scaffold178_cov163-Amphora_coffeaeformis.AAC.8
MRRSRSRGAQKRSVRSGGHWTPPQNIPLWSARSKSYAAAMTPDLHYRFCRVDSDLVKHQEKDRDCITHETF